jgi:predicted dehydrogenase
MKKNIAIIGIGAWGRNLLRNYINLSSGRLVMACDKDEKRLAAARSAYPGLETTADYKDILKRDDIGAVVIATPPAFHYEQAMAFLESGRDVFVEKPLALSVEEGQKLVDGAKKKKAILMVGHIMVYHPATLYLKKLIDEGELGKIYYLYSNRVNLGKVRDIENALWSFAPHDVSIILHLLEEDPIRVTATGSSYLQKGIEDVAFMVLHFDDGKMAHVHVSWLDPHKIRQLTVVGSKKMVVFDDAGAAEKIRIYDKGIDQKQNYDTYGEFLTLRTGDILIPKVPSAEPLAEECRHFLDAMESRKNPTSDGYEALKVLKVLDAAQKSLEAGGAPVHISK